MKKISFWVFAIIIAAVIVAVYFATKSASPASGVVQTPPVNSNLITFTDPAQTFTISYSKEFTLTADELGLTQGGRQDATTPGTLQVVVGLPRSFQPSTNFGEALFTVATSTDRKAVANCITETGEYTTTQGAITVNGVVFTKFTFTGAGAGNFYDTTSYRTVRNGTCYAVEYIIHSTNIGNYSPDQGIIEFDKAKVRGVLEGVVQSFRFL